MEKPISYENKVTIAGRVLAEVAEFQNLYLIPLAIALASAVVSIMVDVRYRYLGLAAVVPLALTATSGHLTTRVPLYSMYFLIGYLSTTAVLRVREGGRAAARIPG